MLLHLFLYIVEVTRPCVSKNHVFDAKLILCLYTYTRSFSSCRELLFTLQSSHASPIILPHFVPCDQADDPISQWQGPRNNLHGILPYAIISVYQKAIKDKNPSRLKKDTNLTSTILSRSITHELLALKDYHIPWFHHMYIVTSICLCAHGNPTTKSWRSSTHKKLQLKVLFHMIASVQYTWKQFGLVESTPLQIMWCIIIFDHSILCQNCPQNAGNRI